MCGHKWLAFLALAKQENAHKKQNPGCKANPQTAGTENKISQASTKIERTNRSFPIVLYSFVFYVFQVLQGAQVQCNAAAHAAATASAAQCLAWDAWDAHAQHAHAWHVDVSRHHLVQLPEFIPQVGYVDEKDLISWYDVVQMVKIGALLTVSR